MPLTSSRTRIRSLWLACAAAATLMASAAVGAPAANAIPSTINKEPVVTDSAVPPGDVSTAEETAGWVSKSWLKKHPKSKVGKLVAGDEVSTANAFKCTPPLNRTCIYVQAEGTYVTKWSTQAIGNVGCVRAKYYVGYALAKTSNLICPTARDGAYYSERTINGFYSNNTALFNDWGDNALGETPVVNVHN